MNNQQAEIKYRSFKCAISSFIANYIAGVLHPFDVIKTRFQSHDGKESKNIVPKYKGIFDAVRSIYKYEGIFGLFKGFHMSLLSQALASSLYFMIYQNRKDKLINNNHASYMNSVAYASLEAGFVATIITQPFWVIKTRMLLNTKTINEWTNFKEMSREIYVQHGVRGFSKGLSMNLILAVLSVAPMYVYEGTKLLYDYLEIPHTPYSEKNFIAGSVSKVVSVFIMFPFSTVRTRIQQNQYVDDTKQLKYSGINDIIIKTWKSEGYRGFFKGLAPNILKGIPQKGLYFYAYEFIKDLFFGIKEYKKH